MMNITKLHLCESYIYIYIYIWTLDSSAAVHEHDILLLSAVKPGFNSGSGNRALVTDLLLRPVAKSNNAQPSPTKVAENKASNVAGHRRAQRGKSAAKLRVHVSI